MASATELAVKDFQHRDVVATGFELKAKIAMTDLATETNAVKPVGEYGRAHACRVRVIVDYDIAVFSFRILIPGEIYRRADKHHEQ